MATSEETCDGNPNFAVICSFITKFGIDCGVNISFPYLQQMLEDTKNDYEDLKELHIHLLRRGRKRVNKEKWEKSIIKFCHEYSSVDAWEMERFGYKKAKLSVKLDLLKHLLELQFDSNAKFKGEVNKQDAQVLRILPIGRDLDGDSYWYQLDKDYNMRLYKEGVGEENVWSLMCSTTEGLKELLSKLQEKAGIVKEEECKAEPSESEVITETKPETKNEDMTSHLSESKPCTIIIKTEKKDTSSLNCVPTDDKKDVVMLEPGEASTNSSVLPSKQILNEPKTDKEVKTECSEVLDVLPKNSKSSFEEPCASDSSKKCDNQKTSEECAKMDTSDCSVTDCTVPMDVQTVKSEEPTTNAIESNDVEMENVENLKSNLSQESPAKNELVQEKTSDSIDSDLNQKPSAGKSDTELKCKSGKIKLYEKWSKEKKKLAAVQQPDKNTECNNPVALTKTDGSSLPIPTNLEVHIASEKVSHTEPVKKDNMKKDDYKQPIDETPMDLSVPSRNTNSLSERKSPCEPAVSSFKKASVLPSNAKHDMYHSLGYDNMSGHALPIKKKHFSTVKEEPHLDNPENIRKSVIFEVKNNKLLNKYQGNAYNDPISSNDRTASMGGSSHLLALQNMCDNNLLSGSKNNMSAMCEKGIKADDSHKVLHVTNNKSSVPDIYDHISKNYSFSAAQISGNKNNTDYVATNTLLKPSAQYSKDKNSLSPMGRDTLTPHKADSLPVVSQHFHEESLIHKKCLESNKYDQNSSKLLENIPLDSHSKSDFGGKIPQHPVTVFSADNMKKYSMNEKNITDDNFSTNKSKDGANISMGSCMSNKKDCHKLPGAKPEKLPSLPKNTQQNTSRNEQPNSKSYPQSSLSDTVTDSDKLGAIQIEKRPMKNEDDIEKEIVSENMSLSFSNVSTKNVSSENNQASLENKHEACEKSKPIKIKSKTDVAKNQEPVLDCKRSTGKIVSEIVDIQTKEPSNVANLSGFADDKKLKDLSASDHDLNLKTDEMSCKKVSSEEDLKNNDSKSVKEECDTSLSKVVGQDSSAKHDVTVDKHALKSSSASDAFSQDTDELKSEPKHFLKSNDISIKADDEIVSDEKVTSAESSSLEIPKIISKQSDETKKEQKHFKKKEDKITKDENKLLAIRSEDENEVLAVKSKDENELLAIKSEDENKLPAVKSEGKDCLASKCNDKSFQSKGEPTILSEKICKGQEENSQEQSANHLLETKINKDCDEFNEIKVTTSEINDKKESLPEESAPDEPMELSKNESKNVVKVDLQATLKSNESQKSLQDEKLGSVASQKSTAKVMPVVKETMGDLVGKVLQYENISKDQNIPEENEPSKSVEPSRLNEKDVQRLSSEDKDIKSKKLDTEDSAQQIKSNFKHDKDMVKSENAVLNVDVEKTKEFQSVCSESVSEDNSRLQEKIKESEQVNSENDSNESAKVSVTLESAFLKNQIVPTEDKKKDSSKADEQSITKSELGVKLSDVDDKKSSKTSHGTLKEPSTLKHDSKKEDNDKSDTKDIAPTRAQEASACENNIEIKSNENVSIKDSKCSKIVEARNLEKIETKTLNEEKKEIESEKTINTLSKDSNNCKIDCDDIKISNEGLFNEEAEKRIEPHSVSSAEEQKESLGEERSEIKSETKLKVCKSSKDSNKSKILSDSKISNVSLKAVELKSEKEINDCNASLAEDKNMSSDVINSDSNAAEVKVVEGTTDHSCKKLLDETEKDTTGKVHDVESSDDSMSQKQKLTKSSITEPTETLENCETKKLCEKYNSSDEKALNSEQKIEMDIVSEFKEDSKVEDLQEKTHSVGKTESEILDTAPESAPGLKREDAADSKEDKTKNHVPEAENKKDLNEKLEEISEDSTPKPTAGKTRSSARRSRSKSAANKTVQAPNKKDISEPDINIVPELSAAEKKLHDEKSVNSDIKDQVASKIVSANNSFKSKTEKPESQLDEPVESPLPKRKGSMRKGRKGRNEIVKDECKSTEETSKCEVISDSKAVKKEPLPDTLGLYYVLQNACLESKLRHPLCSTKSLEKMPPKKPDKKPNLITGFSMDVDEDTTCDIMITNVVKKKRGRLRPPIKPPAPSKTPEVKPKPKPAPPKPPTPKTTPRKRGSRNSKTIAEVSEKTDFNIPEGFLEILGSTQKETPTKKELARKGRCKNVIASEASLPSSDGESTPIKRSRRIQEQHKKKMSELAVVIEREQRELEQLAKKSTAKKTTPQKVPVKAKEVKNCKVVKPKFQPVPEETILDSKRTTRKMNSRSRSITKMTLMYEDESKDSEFSTSRETEKSKKRRRGRSGKRGYKPWDLSSESSSSIEEFTEEEEEEPEEQLVFEVNEDEFACEEVDDSAEPVIVRRARTAKKIEGETEEIVNDDTPCLKCGKYDRPEWILLCDKCDSGYHTTCLIPPLMLIPDGDWFCQPCEHIQLCECLQQELRKLESVLKQKEREELRKQRLAYVGISLDNVLKPEKKEKSDESSKEDEDDEEDEKENKTEKRISKKESRRELSDDDRTEKLYGKRSVRARRNINYQFKEYDELIASAIGQEIFEEKVMEEDFQDEDDEKDDGSDKSFTARVQPKRKRKTRLNALDFSDEDDSGEEYKGSNSSDSECTVPQSSNYEGESAGSDEWKVVKTKSKKAPRRKARRGRRDSSEEDWGEESDSYRPVTRRAASQKAVNYREISTDEDEEWGASKPKKTTIKRKKAFSSEESEASYKEKKPKKKARVRKWGSSSDSESEKSLSLNDESEEEEDDNDGDSSQDSENEWKVKKSQEAKRLKLSINKKVLSTDEESESQESAPAPKKKANKVVSEESEEEDDDEEEEEEEDDEEEESSEEEEDEESEESDEAPSKLPSVEKKVEKQNLKPKTPELVKEITKPAEVVKDLKQKTSENVEPNANMKEKINISAAQDKGSVRPVKKDTTKMVPCVIPYEKSPKSGPGVTFEDESDKISKIKESNLKTVMPSHPTKTAIQMNPPAAKYIEKAPPRVNLPPAENKSFSGTIMEPFDEDDPDSDDEVPLERIPTACVPTPLSNKPPTYEKINEYTPAKELSTFSYSAPEKCFPSTYTSLAPFQDYSSRPSPLKPSLVETYPTNSSSPSKLTPLDTYSRSGSPKGFISLDSYTEARKKKHFYGNPSSEPDAASRPMPPAADNYQGEIRFPPEPYPCPPSPNAYSHRSPPPPQRDPGTPPRMYSQFPDAYAPPRSPEYYQNHQYYASEERIPRPSYQPNYAPSEQGPPYVQNPYVATPVPQPNGGFMIDTLLRARNENEEDELTGVTDIVSYITQE